ncbi:multicopper oxidase family protein [Amycolatopsis coloradensis]|uniref:Multicopper oxidase family protein n=1 Tax=Amycolatopsis coloradensis TaxID=76021 RepID=A0ACD5BFM0_9PSEU
MNAVDRRTFVRAGLALAGTGLLAACTPTGAGASLILPTDPRVGEVEALRRTTGHTRRYRFTAQAAQVDLGGPVVRTWAYDGSVPGKEIRVRAGDVVQAELSNLLPVDTTIHWHGPALRNDMDGVPSLTQEPVPPGGSFTYRFIANTPGTHWLHPHSGTQLDRGLYAAVIVEDPEDPGGYDHDWTVVLDDWIDDTGTTPDEVLGGLRRGDGGRGSMHGMGGGTALGGDVRYPYHLINGRVPAAPVVFTARPRQRARVRLVNAASDTAFRVALGSHRLRVTHSDGFAVQPVDTDALLIGMGERYDIVVTLEEGVFPLVALAEGKDATALAMVRTGEGTPPPSSIRPAELIGDLLRYDDLRPVGETPPLGVPPDVEHRLDLTGGMMSYDWGINGLPFDPVRRLPIREGQRVRITFRNRSMMWHPMHLHGHTFRLGGTGLRKDTVIVLPGRTVACDLTADNPGQWMIHCHNTYHHETGMATILGYRK